MANYPGSDPSQKTDFNASNTPSVEGHTASGHNGPNKEINAMGEDIRDTFAAGTEVSPADTATTIKARIGQILQQIKNITGEGNWYNSVAASISTIWSKFNPTTGHTHTGVTNDAPILDEFDAFTGHKHTGAANDAPRVQTEGDKDYVVSGGVWSADDMGNDLLASMTAVGAYIGGQRIAASTITARAFTASKDTYVDIGSDGVVDYNEVANDATPPALAADHIRIAVIVTGATTTSIDDLRNLSPTNNIRVSVKLTSDQLILNSTPTDIDWDGEDFDFGGLHDNITNKSRITIPSGEGGIYLLSIYAVWDVNSTGERLISVFKNGTSSLVQDRRQAISRSDCSISILTKVDAGDYFTAQVRQLSGSSINFIVAARFSAIKLA